MLDKVYVTKEEFHENLFHEANMYVTYIASFTKKLHKTRVSHYRLVKNRLIRSYENFLSQSSN